MRLLVLSMMLIPHIAMADLPAKPDAHSVAITNPITLYTVKPLPTVSPLVTMGALRVTEPLTTLSTRQDQITVTVETQNGTTINVVVDEGRQIAPSKNPLAVTDITVHPIDPPTAVKPGKPQPDVRPTRPGSKPIVNVRPGPWNDTVHEANPVKPRPYWEYNPRKPRGTQEGRPSNTPNTKNESATPQQFQDSGTSMRQSNNRASHNKKPYQIVCPEGISTDLEGKSLDAIIPLFKEAGATILQETLTKKKPAGQVYVTVNEKNIVTDITCT